MGRLLAIGDVHGCLTALDTLVGAVAPQRDDVLVFLGDYVDRGPDSRGVIDRILEWRRTHRVVTLRGNHEIMMAAARLGGTDLHLWLTVGGREALESYSPHGRSTDLATIPENHWEFLERGCQDWFETDDFIFVHANLNPALPLDKQPSDWLHWQPLRPTRYQPHCSGKTMICGHTAQLSHRPLLLERAICIDTHVYADGWLTCYDVESGAYWQANERGHLRCYRLQTPAPEGAS